MNAAAPALIALIAALSGDGQPCLPEANRAVVAFARQAIGAPVGDGSCTALVAKAYRDADLTIERADEEIRWGRPVAKRADWLAGDVLEFRDVVFAGRRRKQRDGADGVGSYRLKMEKHTAIVDEVRDGGRVIVVLHQNVGPDDAPEAERRAVRRDVLRMADLQRGTIAAYRPDGKQSIDAGGVPKKP